MPNLILHIGPHKTGTSAIQSFCHNNWAVLKDNGFHYAKSGMWNDFSHNKIFFLLKNSRVGILDKIEREIKTLKDNEIYIISSEVLARTVGKEFLNPFISLIKDRFNNRKIIIYARRQDNWVESVYRQWVKSPEIAVKAKPTVFYQNNKNSFDIYDIIESWKTVFNPDSINVRIYERGKAENNAPADFVEAIGLNTPNLNFNTSYLVHPSLDNKSLAIIRALNWLPSDIETRQNLRKIIFRNISKPKYKWSIFSFYLGKKTIQNKDQPSIFSPQFRNKIIQDFSESNYKLAVSYLHSEVLFMEELPDENEQWIDPLISIDQEVIDDTIKLLFKSTNIGESLFTQFLNSKIRNLT